MKDVVRFLGIIFLVAAIGFSIVACSDGGGGGSEGGGGGSNGSPLDGTWVQGTSMLVIKGSSYTWWIDNTPAERGTITASGGNVTTKAVDMYFNNAWLSQSEAISSGNFTADHFLPWTGTYVLSNNNETLTISFWGTWLKLH